MSTSALVFFLLSLSLHHCVNSLKAQIFDCLEVGLVVIYVVLVKLLALEYFLEKFDLCVNGLGSFAMRKLISG